MSIYLTNRWATTPNSYNLNVNSTLGTHYKNKTLILSIIRTPNVEVQNINARTASGLGLSNTRQNKFFKE